MYVMHSSKSEAQRSNIKVQAQLWGGGFWSLTLTSVFFCLFVFLNLVNM